MTAKRKLDDMLADENSKPVIRRGQGVRLSTEEAPPVVLGTQDRTIAETQNRTVAETQPNVTKRVNRGYMLREDLILGCKRLALNDGRKLYEVMEEALAEYLSRHGQAAS
jgi:hypothetical protein